MPTSEHIDAVAGVIEQSMNMQGPMRRLFGVEVGEATEVLLRQEATIAAQAILDSTGTAVHAAMLDALVRAEKAPVEVQGPVRRSEAVSRCGYQIIDRDGDEAPCDEPATGWRWYQDVGEHEDLIDVACEFHRNEGGDRMHGLMQQVQTLRADLRHIAECLGEDPDDVPEGHRLVDHMALRVGYLRGRDAGFDDVEAERDALAARVAHLAEPGDPDARMDAYYYGFTRTGIGVVDNILSAVAKAGKSYHGTDMWGEELFGGGTCESRIQDAADAAAEQIRAALTGSEADTSDTHLTTHESEEDADA